MFPVDEEAEDIVAQISDKLNDINGQATIDLVITLNHCDKKSISIILLLHLSGVFERNA